MTLSKAVKHQADQAAHVVGARNQPATINDLRRWVEEDIVNCDVLRGPNLAIEFEIESEGDCGAFLNFYDGPEQYTIAAINPSPERPEGSLGTVDLPDGPFTRETWEKILDDLIDRMVGDLRAYRLISLGRVEVLTRDLEMLERLQVAVKARGDKAVRPGS